MRFRVSFASKMCRITDSAVLARDGDDSAGGISNWTLDVAAVLLLAPVLVLD